MCHSLDLREKVLFVREKENLTIDEVSRRFNVGRASVYRWIKKIHANKTRNKPATKIDMKALKQDVIDYPDAYQFERASRFQVSNSCILFALRRLRVSYKKNAKSSQGKQRKTIYL